MGYVYFHGEGLEEVRKGVYRLAANRLCVPTPLQAAIALALERFSGGLEREFNDFMGELKRRRDYAFKALSELEGLEVAEPRGAFYPFPRLSLDVEDSELVRRLLVEKGVLVVPGSGFSMHDRQYFRVVFLPPVEILKEAFTKMGEFLRGLASAGP